MTQLAPRPAITLCADDYGLAPGVNTAIRTLIAMGRLQATGCMTCSPHWPQAARALKELDGRADIGIHLTLTDHAPLGAMPHLAPQGKLPGVGALLKRAALRRLDRAEIAAELERQVDAFEAHFGRPPDFLDGHHHVHQFPIIGEVVIELWRRRLHGKGWVRSSHLPLPRLAAQPSPLRALIISATGWSFRRLLKKHGVPHNREFRGIYDFSGDFAMLFRKFTANPPPGTLMMVHPGLADDELKAVESLTTQREAEYRFLASDECVLELASRGISLRRLAV